MGWNHRWYVDRPCYDARSPWRWGIFTILTRNTSTTSWECAVKYKIEDMVYAWWSTATFYIGRAAIFKYHIPWSLDGRGDDAPVCWPPRSPDHNLFDFFFWGCLKGKVYVTPVTTREDLWQRIVIRSSNKIRQGGYFWHVQIALRQRLRARNRANWNSFVNLLAYSHDR